MAFAPNYTNFRPTAAAAVRPVFNNPQVKSLSSIMSTEAQETMSDTVQRNQEIAYGLAKQTLAESGAIRRVEIQGENQRKLERLKQKSPIAKLNAIANIRQSRANVLSPIVLPSSEANSSVSQQMAGQRLQSGMTDLNLKGDSTGTKKNQSSYLSEKEQILEFSKLSEDEQGLLLDDAAKVEPVTLTTIISEIEGPPPFVSKEAHEQFLQNNEEAVKKGFWNVGGGNIPY